MRNQSAQIRAMLERTPVASNWPEAAIDEVCAHSEIRTYGDGERVYSAGDGVDAIWIITEGSFLLSKTWPNGRRFVYAFLKSGETTGELPVFDGLPAALDVTAHGDTTAVLLPGDAVRAIAMRFPDAALQIISHLCRRARSGYQVVELHAMNSVRCRIAKAILNIAQGQTAAKGDEIVVDSRISQEDLADVVCAARQSVNRELRGLMREGIVKQRYRTLVILDREKLMRVACEDDQFPPLAHPANLSDNHLYPTTD